MSCRSCPSGLTCSGASPYFRGQSMGRNHDRVGVPRYLAQSAGRDGAPRTGSPIQGSEVQGGKRPRSGPSSSSVIPFSHSSAPRCKPIHPPRVPSGCSRSCPLSRALHWCLGVHSTELICPCPEAFYPFLILFFFEVEIRRSRYHPSSSRHSFFTRYISNSLAISHRASFLLCTRPRPKTT